jgi:inner membrane protein
MAWWFWTALGLVLVAIEIATPGGFFIIFFGVAALVVGELDMIGLVPQAWAQWLLFPVVALISLKIFRRPLLKRMRRGSPARADADSVVGTVAVAKAPIVPGGLGQAELRGTPWSARNVGATPIAAGQRCLVVAVDGLMLDLRPE